MPGQILAATLTTSDVDDASQVGLLPDQVTDPVASFTTDGAYDRGGVYNDVAARHPDTAVIVPPRSRRFQAARRRRTVSVWSAPPSWAEGYG